MGSRGQGSLVIFSDSPNWISCHHRAGREHRVSTGTSDLKAAKRFHKQKLDEVAADRQGLRPYLTPEAQRYTVAEALDELVADLTLRGAKSLRTVSSHLKRVRGHFGPWKLVEVTAEAVDKFILSQQAKGLKAATINRGVQLLGQALKLSHRRGKLATVPYIRHLPKRNARKGFFERAQFEAVRAHLSPVMQAAATFAYLSGWRRAEILGLTWDRVDMEQGVVRLEDSKNGQGRLLALDDTLREVMLARQQARLLETPSGAISLAELVFHRDGYPVVDFRKEWLRACKAAGLAATDPATGKVKADRLFHDLRRTSVRNLVRAGVHEGVAMSITGHKTRAVFERYNITSEADLREAQAKVGQHYHARQNP